MATPGLVFRIGGVVDPTYNGALLASVVSAKKAALEIEAAQNKIFKKNYHPVNSGNIENEFMLLQQMKQLEDKKTALLINSNAERAALEKKFSDYKIRQAAAFAAVGQTSWAQTFENPAIIAAKKASDERIAILRAEQLAAIALVARQGGIGAASGGHGHKYGGQGGVISEIAVIGHEILQGRGSGRILGSISILAGRLGLLGKLVKSTAQAEIELALAENVSAGAMARNAIATQASATATQIDKDAAIADSVAQNVRATAATEAAEMAAAAATVTLGPLGWLLLAGIAVTGVIVGLVFHYRKLAREAKNLADMTNLLSLSFTEQAKVIDEAAKKHQEAIDWETKHVQSMNNLKDANDEAVKSLREHAQAEIELARARGASKQRITAMELAAEREELKLLKKQADAMEAKHHADWLALQDANKRADQFNFGTGKDSATMLDAAKKRTEENGLIVDAAIAAMKAKKINIGPQYSYTPGSSYPTLTNAGTSRPANEKDHISFKIGDKEYSGSVEQLRSNFNEIKSEVARLETLQTQIENSVKSGQTLAGKDLEDYNAKKKERDELAAKLGIDEIFKSKIANAETGTKDIFGLTDRQRAGALISGPAVALLDVSKQQLAVLHRIDKNTGGKRSNPYGD